jgi:hypothetical protein
LPLNSSTRRDKTVSAPPFPSVGIIWISVFTI